jgi:hypothetical protein
MLVIDTNTSCKGKGAYLKSQGVTTVGRYYGVQESYRDIIDDVEAKELCQNGISIFVVFEKTGNASDLVLSRPAGKLDAQAAVKQAGIVKQPAGSAIYFAAEGLPNGYGSADLSNLQDYFMGIADGLAGQYTIGVYGDGIVCQTLQNSYCKFAWLAAASTDFSLTCKYFGGKTPAWDLAQVPPLDMAWKLPHNGGFLSVDFDVPNLTRNNGAFGAFVVPTV